MDFQEILRRALQIPSAIRLRRRKAMSNGISTKVELLAKGEVEMVHKIY